VRTLQAEDQAIAEDKVKIEEYKRESDKLRKIIHALKTEAVVFQSTKCCACDQTLDLPSVHFLCYHGYHQHCFQALADNDQECPKCSEENKKILDIIKSQDAARHQHDQFHAQLEKAEDGFSIVAEYFGRGLFTAPPTVQQQIHQQQAKQQQLPSTGGTHMTGSGMMSEARLRAEQRTYSPAGNLESEGRLRAAASTAGPAIQESEARLRQAAGRSNFEQESEGRMRLAGNTGSNNPYQGTSEARLRSEQGSEAMREAPSNARLTLMEASRSQPYETGSLASNITRPTVHQRSPRLQRQEAATTGPPRPVPSKDKVSPLNPFGSPESNESMDDSNPFASGGDNLGVAPATSNPFGTPKPSPKRDVGNPFGDEGDDYDDEKNPFA